MRHPTRNTQETERERDLVNDIIIHTSFFFVVTLGDTPKETPAQKTHNTQETLKKHSRNTQETQTLWNKHPKNTPKTHTQNGRHSRRKN